MAKKARKHVEDLRGATRLAVEATKSVADLVQAMHVTIAGGPDILGRPLAGPARLLTGIVYGSIRGVTQLVGSGIDGALAQLAPLLGESAPGVEREALLAVLNGVLGDYLSDTKNPLAIEMRLCHDGHPLELERAALRSLLPHAGSKLLVLVHGSCMNDRQRTRRGYDHGKELARDHGYTPVYVHYNSGLHISANGRALSELLAQLVREWPVPVEEIAILGHSMGGLVARSACHFSEAAPHAWRGKLRKLICVGTPHHGAPLERGGSFIDLLLGASRYSAPLARLGKIRSAGVTDMRFGSVLDAHWEGRDRFAFEEDARAELTLPEGVSCYALAGTSTRAPGTKLSGDGMVPVDSALGRHAKTELTLKFPEAHQAIAYGVGHLELLDRAVVYDTLHAWLAD